MFDNQTTFIIGAGASNEFEFPVSNELVTRISLCLKNVVSKLKSELPNRPYQPQDDVPFHRFIDANMDAKIIYNCIRVMSCNENPDGSRANTINYKKLFDYIKVADSINDKIETLTSTIDEFLGRRETTPDEKIISKIAISSIIRYCEQNSVLFENHNKKIPYGISQLNSTYLFKLYRILSQNGVDEIFTNRNFIIFNYDLCFEQLFFKFIQKAGGRSAQEAFDLISKANIIHPYGTACEFVLDPSGETSFGMLDGSINYDQFIERASYDLRLHTDVEINHELKNNIERAVYEAKTLVILGFGYHRDNLKLLSTSKEFKKIPKRRVIANFYKMSETNIRVIKERLGSIAYFGEIHPADDRISNDKNLSASQLIDEYSQLFN